MNNPFWFFTGLFLSITFLSPVCAEQAGSVDKKAVEQAANGRAVHEVKTYKYKFDPLEVTIKVGDTVRWVNVEKRQYHSVWFRNAGDQESEYFFPDETFEKTFNEPGDFPYVCGPHEVDYDMKGTVHVVE
jgi:plastocyanin